MAVDEYLINDGGGAADEQTLVLDGGGAADDHLPPRTDGGPAGYARTMVALPRMVGNPSQGDPRLILGANGCRLQFTSGQPLMDQGLENAALISLFTELGWCGNTFVNLNSQIGSRFLEACNQPITRQQLIRIQHAAELALRQPAFGSVRVAVTNPTGYNLRVDITLGPGQSLTLQRSAGNWSFQANEPAHRGVLWH